MNLFKLLRADTDFVTSRESYDGKQHVGGAAANSVAFFQAILGTTAGHKVIKRYLDNFLHNYRQGAHSPDGCAKPDREDASN